jgi:hypothetical protein
MISVLVIMVGIFKLPQIVSTEMALSTVSYYFKFSSQFISGQIAKLCETSLSLSCCSHLEHRASVKRFVSLQFLNPRTVGRTPWTGDEPFASPLPTQTQNKRRHTSMPWVGFKLTIAVFEWAKTVHALDRATTVIGCETSGGTILFWKSNRMVSVF